MISNSLFSQEHKFVKPASFIPALVAVFVLAGSISAWGLCKVGAEPGILGGGTCDIYEGKCSHDEISSHGATCADSTEGYATCTAKSVDYYIYLPKDGSAFCDFNTPCVKRTAYMSVVGGKVSGKCGGG